MLLSLLRSFLFPAFLLPAWEFLLLWLLLLSCCGFVFSGTKLFLSMASQALIRQVFECKVGIYPSKSNLDLHACGSDHSNNPTISFSLNLDSVEPKGNKGKALFNLLMAAAICLVDKSAGLCILRCIHCRCISNARNGNTVLVTAWRAVATCSVVVRVATPSTSLIASASVASKAIALSPLTSALTVEARSVPPVMEF